MPATMVSFVTKVLITTAIFSSVSSLRLTHQNSGRVQLSIPMSQEIDIIEAVYIDPYADMLDLNKPLDDVDLIVAESSISSLGQGEKKKKESLRHSGKLRTGLRVKDAEYWDAFLEKHFGVEDEEPEPWILEVRDMIELKRGKAIWSKRSDKQIKKALKKSQEGGPSKIPPAVEMVITSVYFDKKQTMGALKRDNEVAYGEYRKFMVEQKKKLKSNPVPVVKSKISERWLMRKPGSTESYSAFFAANAKRLNHASRAPVTPEMFAARALTQAKAAQKRNTVIVLDEITRRDMFTDPLATVSNIAKDAKSEKTATDIGLVDKNSRISSSVSIMADKANALNTASLLNWNKSEQEIRAFERKETRKRQETEKENQKQAQMLLSEMKDMYQYTHADPVSNEQYYVVI